MKQRRSRWCDITLIYFSWSRAALKHHLCESTNRLAQSNRKRREHGFPTLQPAGTLEEPAVTLPLWGGKSNQVLGRVHSRRQDRWWRDRGCVPTWTTWSHNTLMCKLFNFFSFAASPAMICPPFSSKWDSYSQKRWFFSDQNLNKQLRPRRHTALYKIAATFGYHNFRLLFSYTLNPAA